MATLTLQRFLDTDEFTRIAEPFLMRDEAAHCLQIGLLGGMSAGEWRDNVFMAVVYEDAEPALIALRTPPHALILSACAVPEAISRLVGHVAGLAPEDLPGEVMGPASVVSSFSDQWTAEPTRTATPSERERIYRLDSVTPVTGVPGEAVAAAPTDRSLLIDWFSAFHAEALPDQPFDAAQTVERWLSQPGRRELWFWQIDGEPVSLAGAGNPTENGIRLGPVYTPPEHRKRGYASALVAWLSQRQLDAGRQFCTLFTDLDNPTSNHIYTEIGYRPVVDMLKYRLTG